MSDRAAESIRESRLTTWTEWSLYALLGVHSLSLTSGLLRLGLLTDARTRDHTAALNTLDIVGVILTIAWLIMLIVSAVFVLRWIYRANINARRMGATGMEYTPGWSVGWFFVPFANLWKPYQAMKEIWKASSRPTNWENEEVPPLVGWWWFLWIVSNVTDNLADRGFDQDTIRSVPQTALNIISDVVNLPLAVVLLLIIRRIHAMQSGYSQAEIFA